MTTPAPICAGDHWCWINPVPAYGLDGASWSFSADDAWLVGRAGSILRWSSGAWSPFESGTEENLRAVWGADATEAWAIGDHGTILRWDGQSWSAAVSPVASDLLCISGTARDDVWAMGAKGTVIHWDGSAWSALAVPEANDLTLLGVWAGTRTSVFAVGASGIVRWDGRNWFRAPAGFDQFFAIWGANDHDVWVVGRYDNVEFPSGRSAIARWDGTTWAFASAPSSGATPFSSPLTSIWGTAPNDVWV